MARFIDILTLKELATQSACVAIDCRCLRWNLEGWAAWPLSYCEEDFAQMGTLVQSTPEEATLQEFHPAATDYWSSSAPIAPQFYPYNQSTVWRCCSCERIYLRHNDDGAYHVAPRISLLQVSLIVDAVQANDCKRSTATG
jgi:hypothetical protein